jgi:hypothetical protein
MLSLRRSLSSRASLLPLEAKNPDTGRPNRLRYLVECRKAPRPLSNPNRPNSHLLKEELRSPAKVPSFFVSRVVFHQHELEGKLPLMRRALQILEHHLSQIRELTRVIEVAAGATGEAEVAPGQTSKTTGIYLGDRPVPITTAYACARLSQSQQLIVMVNKTQTT